VLLRFYILKYALRPEVDILDVLPKTSQNTYIFKRFYTGFRLK